MFKRNLQATLFFAGIFCWSGCDTSKPSPLPPAIPEAAVDPPATPSKTVVTPNRTESTKDHGISKSANSSYTDPKTTFLLGDQGEQMIIVAESGDLPEDHFQIVSADPASNSLRFIVENAVPSEFSPPIIGTKQPTNTVRLPQGFSAVPNVGVSELGFPLRIYSERTQTSLALVSPGVSVVGSGSGPEESRPSFKVRLDPFYMEITEVTVERYMAYWNERKEKKKAPPLPLNPKDDPLMPILGVSWGHAQEYARWAGMELPTEAEFEKATRGPSGFRTPWGNGKSLWSSHATAKVGSYSSDLSPFGIMDLAANAKEWCFDTYSTNSHKDAEKAGAADIVMNWHGTKNSKTPHLRVVKGGGNDLSAWHREGREASKNYPDVGFRCVLRLPKDASQFPSKTIHQP